MMLVGLRGVGKTVLLDQMRRDAERNGIQTVRVEAQRGVLFQHCSRHRSD
jgi:predicted AAA+ superfamily ATPase